MHLITLSKKISENFGISRKKAEILIKKGLVFVNNKKEFRPFIKISNNELISIEKLQDEVKTKLIIFNKPKGCITTRSDEKDRKTIYFYLPKIFHDYHYIGRLDYNTEGLLLLTDNKKFKRTLEDPKSEIVRRYVVKISGHVTEKKILSMNKKIYGELTYKKPNIITNTKNKNLNTLIFELKEGKNREIRKICELFNLKVENLKRTNFGKFHLKGLALGGYKEITI